ncbi:MAG TPA: hypothetical protein VFW07_17350 [Parafilimonas sp.]|nr:hypothetical protein [Parafilimonas sp.]
MRKISFIIKVRDKTYNGFLHTNDFLQPPKNYLVFMENHMVGELICKHDWTFTQGRWHKILGKLHNDECDDIARFLGKIADMFFKAEK